MLAPRNAGTRLCRQWGANSAGDRQRLRVKCWRLVTETQGFAGNGAPTWPVTGCPFLFFQRSVGADLVHRPPQSLVLPSLLHQVSGLFRRSVGAGLVHEPSQGLVLSFPLHQVPGPFRRSAGADLVHRPPQGPVLSSPLHQVSGPFRRSAGTDLVHKSQQNLVLSFPLHQVSGTFQRSAGADLVHKSPQNLVLSFPLHQVSGPFRRSAGNGAPTRPAADYRPALGGEFPAGALKASGGTPEAHELLFLCSISIQSISIS